MLLLSNIVLVFVLAYYIASYITGGLGSLTMIIILVFVTI